MVSWAACMVSQFYTYIYFQSYSRQQLAVAHCDALEYAKGVPPSSLSCFRADAIKRVSIGLQVLGYSISGFPRRVQRRRAKYGVLGPRVPKGAAEICIVAVD